jgi:tRNA(His) 5'-end guanylyltransferase
MKHNYEDRYRIYLTRRTPIIIRLDGKAFTKLTKGCNRPFDKHFQDCMVRTTIRLCHEIQGVKLGYTQSDEISLLLTDFDTLTTEAWFDNNLQKMVSISAAMASTWFTLFYGRCGRSPALFDSRVFNIPKEEVCNYFIWRQKDWIRNSVSMLTRAHFSHKECMYKKQSDMHEMLYSVSINWADLEPRWKNGVTVHRDEAELWNIFDMIYTNQEDRDYVANLLKTK